MQPSELVTETAMRLREELRKHDLWATEAVALAVVEAVALDLYERGLREAADYIAGLGEQYEAAAVSAKTRKDANYFRGRARMYAQDAAAILSKLRAPT